MLTLLLTRNLRASPSRPQPVLLLLITVSQEQEFTFLFVGPCTSLYNPISSLYRVAIPSWVCTALPAVSHTNLEQQMHSVLSSGPVSRMLSTAGPSFHPEELCLWVAHSLTLSHWLPPASQTVFHPPHGPQHNGLPARTQWHNCIKHPAKIKVSDILSSLLTTKQAVSPQVVTR